ncbi:MAG: hypothetical protein M9925_05070 [Chloroflexi bacterium]|nr:hypothetical protein [Chloroflexota bacterium]
MIFTPSWLKSSVCVPFAAMAPMLICWAAPVDEVSVMRPAPAELKVYVAGFALETSIAVAIAAPTASLTTRSVPVAPPMVPVRAPVRRLCPLNWVAFAMRSISERSWTSSVPMEVRAALS